MKHTLTLLGLLISSLCLSQGDFLNEQDSIFIEFDQYGQKVFKYEMNAGETLYSLSRYFGLSLEELYQYNPTLIQNEWHIGQEVLIPLPNKAIIRYLDQDTSTEDLVGLFYSVKPGDTMYGIAVKHFKMPVEDLLVRNELENHTLSLGQVLLVGWMSRDGIPEEMRSWNNNPNYARSNTLGEFYKKGKSSDREVITRGMAFWHKEGDAGSDLYALHRKAAINSVIGVHNPMTKKTVYAKVIGRLPDNIYPDKVMIVVSPKVADLLGALDAQFFVNVRYLR